MTLLPVGIVRAATVRIGLAAIGTGGSFVTLAREGKLGKDFRSGKREGWLLAQQWQVMFPLLWSNPQH